MFKKYIEPTDPEAFIDFPEKPSCPDYLMRGGNIGYYVECPRCQGHGYWNLILNAYPLPKGMEDTPENRHEYCHFKSGCMQCFQGWTHKDNAKCIHDYAYSQNIGRCLNIYKCTKCGSEREIDSSD